MPADRPGGRSRGRKRNRNHPEAFLKGRYRAGRAVHAQPPFEQHRQQIDADGAAELADEIDRRGGVGDVALVERLHRGHAERRNDHAQSDAADQEPDAQDGKAGAPAGEGQQQAGQGEQREPGDDDASRLDAVGPAARQNDRHRETETRERSARPLRAKANIRRHPGRIPESGKSCRRVPDRRPMRPARWRGNRRRRKAEARAAARGRGIPTR